MRYAWILGATALVAPSLALAQTGTPGQQPQTQTQMQGRPGAQQGMAAQDFVRNAAIGNMFEIQSSEYVADRSDNEQVVSFAERMVRDHGNAGEQLRRATDISPPTRLDRQHRQMLDRLRQAPENRVERVYIDMQVDAHRRTVDMFERYAAAADDARLRQFAQTTLPTLRDHLQAAQQIQQSFANQQVGAAGAGLDGTQQQAGLTGQQQQAGRTGQQQEGDASRIVVRTPPPTVRVDQGSPTVSVQQARPDVTVRQPQPEILVRQPQPTVTVDIPQPEIVVRMPQPDVNVSMARPQISVEQPRPQVRVAEGDQAARVQVERGEPEVRYQAQDEEPRVSIQRVQGGPNVRYERSEPRVVVNQAQGQPNVRYERMTSDEAARSTAGSQEAGATGTDPARTAAGVDTDDQRGATAGMAGRTTGTTPMQDATADRTAAVDDTVSQPTGAGAGASMARAVSVADLTDMNLYNARGDELGDVDRVVLDGNGRHHLVVGAGGFLGIGERDVPIPLDQVVLSGDRLVIRGVTEDQIRSMPAVDTRPGVYRDVAGTTRMNMVGAER